MNRKHGLNLLDTILLTSAAAAVAVTAFFVIGRAGDRTADTCGIECILRLPVSESAYPVRVGDALRNENGTVAMGTVTDVRIIPHRELLLHDGDAIYTEMEGLYETELTVRMTATSRRGNGLRVGDIRVCAGATGAYRVAAFFVAGVTTVSVRPGGEVAA